MSTPRSNGSPFELLIFDCDGVLVDSKIVEAFYPSHLIPAKTQFGLEEIFSKLTPPAEHHDG
jgi:beta-phosphoglucomutase-like phosphatase (HAD superfamily)